MASSQEPAIHQGVAVNKVGFAIEIRSSDERVIGQKIWAHKPAKATTNFRENWELTDHETSSNPPNVSGITQYLLIGYAHPESRERAKYTTYQNGTERYQNAIVGTESDPGIIIDLDAKKEKSSDLNKGVPRLIGVVWDDHKDSAHKGGQVKWYEFGEAEKDGFRKGGEILKDHVFIFPEFRNLTAKSQTARAKEWSKAVTEAVGRQTMAQARGPPRSEAIAQAETFKFPMVVSLKNEVFTLAMMFAKTRDPKYVERLQQKLQKLHKAVHGSSAPLSCYLNDFIDLEQETFEHADELLLELYGTKAKVDSVGVTASHVMSLKHVIQGGGVHIPVQKASDVLFLYFRSVRKLEEKGEQVDEHEIIRDLADAFAELRSSREPAPIRCDDKGCKHEEMLSILARLLQDISNHDRARAHAWTFPDGVPSYPATLPEFFKHIGTDPARSQEAFTSFMYHTLEADHKIFRNDTCDQLDEVATMTLEWLAAYRSERLQDIDSVTKEV